MAISLSCRSPRESESALCLSELKAEIKNSWSFGTNVGYYQTTGMFIHKLDSAYKKCLIGKSKEEIISLFGEPSCTNSFGGNFGATGTIEYLLARCDTTRRNYMCSYYVFYIDSARKVFMAENDERGLITQD